jgi:uncharacterized protein (DUF169 family)
MSEDWKALAEGLRRALATHAPPIAITFHDAVPDVPRHDAPMPPPTPDGRTGRVSAGCVFWMESAVRTFTTVPEDHGNCSVGSMTHGMKTLDQVAGNADVAALLESGWVTMDAVPQIPVVATRPAAVSYGPLAETPHDPDVVLLRLNARQLMMLSDAIPGLRIEGKPQCHIVAIAKEHGEAAASVGCQLSRVRTGMANDEMTCALPASRLADVVARLERTAAADRAVAAYAAADARRFAG